MDGPAERVGVVFVHGIGSQSQSSTLRLFADPLAEWLADWHRERKATGFEITLSRLSYGEGLPPDVPAHVKLRIPSRSGARTWPEAEWMLTEAWWATRLEAPDFATIALWSARIYVRVLLRLISAISDKLGLLIDRQLAMRGDTLRVRAADPDIARRSRRGTLGPFIDRVALILLAAGYAAFGFIGYFTLVLPLAFIAQIPIRKIQEVAVVSVLRLFLIENIGDFHTYLYDEIQARHIRRSVPNAVEWLVRQGCGRVCVVAHSQGCVVAYDALTAPEIWPSTPLVFEKVTKLITVGEALNNAWDLAPKEITRLTRDLDRRIRWLDVWSIYDYVPGAPLHREGAESVEVTNGMNFLTEHDGYFHNREEFVSRLAQEIDEPSGAYWHSRFALRSQPKRVEWRVQRVRTLLVWRLAGMALFFFAAAARLFNDGWAALERDGSALWDAVSRLPLVDLILGSVAVPSGLERAFDVAVAVAVYALAFQVLYLIPLRLIWRPWHARAMAMAIRDDPPKPDRTDRTAQIVGTLQAAALFFALAVLIVGRP